MRIETKTFTVEYKMFDVGEIIVPISEDCPLPDGRYIVTSCVPPQLYGDDAIVFVAGHKFGMDTSNFIAADQQHQQE